MLHIMDSIEQLLPYNPARCWPQAFSVRECDHVDVACQHGHNQFLDVIHVAQRVNFAGRNGAAVIDAFIVCAAIY